MSSYVVRLGKRILVQSQNPFILLPCTSQNLQRFWQYSTIKTKEEELNNMMKKSLTNDFSDQSYLEQILIKKNEEPSTTAQKVRKKAENTFYYTVAAVSIVLVASIAYFLIKFFISSDSPQRIYSKSLKLVLQDDRCMDLLGSKITAHGENTGRGRRRHITNLRYVKDGEERVRVMFHLKGEKRNGRAFAEIAKKDGQWDYRFLYVESVELIPETVVIIDNRQ